MTQTLLLAPIRILLLVTMPVLPSLGQELAKLKLTDAEIPSKYTATDEMLYKSVQAASFYEQIDLYESLIGKIKNQEYQSYESKGDKGAIYYYEFENEFTETGFLEGLLWGGRKPTKAHPEEYLVRDNILIIWSFADKSELKMVSKEKIISVLD